MRQSLYTGVIALAMASANICSAASDDYMLVDLSAGKPYAISYTNETPAGGWTSAVYKTSKVVLRKIPRGTFLMGSPSDEVGRTTSPAGSEDQRSVTISNDFYLGVFEMTEGQCTRLSTSAFTKWSADSRNPVGREPDNSAVLPFFTSVRDSLNTGTATNFTLPDEAQWEYACRAGSAGAYFFGADAVDLHTYARYGQSAATYNPQAVGLLEPNAFGLYDVYGNVAETVYKYGANGEYWACGGLYSSSSNQCRSASRETFMADQSTRGGFRMCLVVPLKMYTVTVSSGTPVTASGTNGQWVAISANPPTVGSNLIFDRWAGDTNTVADIWATNTLVRILGSNIAVTATYRLAPFWLSIENGRGTNRWQHDKGDVVAVTADVPAPGKVFSHWAVYASDPRLGDQFDPLKPSTTLVMPAADVTLVTVYADIPTYRLTVNGGVGGGTYTNGQAVTIYASAPPAHHSFLWTGNTASLADPTYWVTTLVMPASDVTVTASYPPIAYRLTVNGGAGGGSYTNGQIVAIAAAGAPTAQHGFFAWSGDTNGVDNVYAATTTVKIVGAATLAPRYRPLPLSANTYMIVDLAASQASAAVSYLDAPPAGGWGGEYLTNKVVLRKVEAGSFTMGSAGETSRVDEPQHRVTLAQPYYLGLFEITQAQWTQVTGAWPSRYTNQDDRATHPVERVSYAAIRGATNGAKWPSSSAVDSDSFMGRVRTRTGDANFDLPTEAQWEYACRAGTTSPYAGDALADLGFYSANSGGHTWAIGQQLANDWGFHDMHGNVAEFCLDWYAGAYATTSQTDPKGAASSPSGRRITRGGGCLSDADGCRSAARGNLLVTNASYNTGLRLARPVGKSYPLTIIGGFVNTGGWFVAGTKIPISASAVAGWTFSQWLATPASVSLGASYQAASGDTLVTMPTQAVTLAASYVPTQPVVVTLDPAGGVVSPATLTVGAGGLYGGPTGAALPTPSRLGHMFQGWRSEPGGAGDLVTGATPVATTNAHALTASWLALANQMPIFTKCTPTNAAPAVNEGATLTLSVTASDSTDPDAVQRGMSNVTWFVNGDLALTTKAGAPGAIASTLSYKPGTNVVNGAASRTVVVRAVALDRLGGAAETNWPVNVINLPASQTITFKAFPVVTLGVTNFNPGAVASSKLPVTYASSNEGVAQIVDGLLQVVGAGTATITALQLGNFDFKAAAPVKQTLTVKARLDAEVPTGGGTVSGAGVYMPGTRVTLTARPSAGFTFFRWEDGSQAATRPLTVPGSNVLVTASFGTTAGVPSPNVTGPGPQQATVGAFWRLPLDIFSESLPTVTVTGLPTGLRYNSGTKSIEGVPTVSVTNRLVTIRATNVNVTPTITTFALTVLPLPTWAQGAFSGAATMEPLGSGSVSLGVTALGALSGKLTLRGTNMIFSATSYASRDGEDAFWFTTTAKVGVVSYPLALKVYAPTITDTTGSVPATLGKVSGVLGETGGVELYRTVWKDAGMTAVATNFSGYYTATLPSIDAYGSGYLTFTVDKVGGFKTVGKLADGTAVSLSGSLVLNEAGQVFAVIYVAPAAYKGGGLFGVAEFVKPEEGAVKIRSLNGGALIWESFNPLATGDYAAGGFCWCFNVVGGWYDTVGNLYRYYEGRSLEVETAGAPTPAITVGTNRYESVWWDPAGVALTPVTNRYGVMTGLAAPAAGTPVKVDGSYRYAETHNAVGLTFSLTRATGVFRGSFKAWFDYGTTHTYRAVACEGALTPERETPEDGVEGRGFFVWPSTSSYQSPQGRAIHYSFSESYDFILNAQ